MTNDTLVMILTSGQTIMGSFIRDHIAEDELGNQETVIYLGNVVEMRRETVRLESGYLSTADIPSLWNPHGDYGMSGIRRSDIVSMTLASDYTHRIYETTLGNLLMERTRIMLKNSEYMDSKEYDTGTFHAAPVMLQ